MNIDTLFDLIHCHSTPGDEDEVAQLLLSRWRSAGWDVCSHGRYAVSARQPQTGDRQRPVLLICAHMDSPGFAVQAVSPNGIRLTSLGGVRVEEQTVAVELKTRHGREHAILCHEEKEEDVHVDYSTAWLEGVTHGDRACYVANPEYEDGFIRSPFLDNRLGCAVLLELACRLAGSNLPFEVRLGATSCEEIGGFGAQVLATAVKPDAVICLDATYEAPEQGVLLGNGPVLTLSDASALLGTFVRDRVRAFFERHGLPLQTEVYNYSGTDSRAFPQQGLTAPVLPLLVPTTGNHTPCECAAGRDVDFLLDALVAICRTPPEEGPFPPGFLPG